MGYAFDRTLGVLAVLLCGAAHAGVFDGTWRPDDSTVRLLTAGRPQVIRVQDGQYACQTCDPPLLVRADGTDQPTSGVPDVDTISIAVLDERSVIQTLKRGGKTVSIRKLSVSDDGGSAINEIASRAANGTEVVSREFWTRQSAGPPGSHAVSGSWIRGQVRDEVVTVTFSATGETLTMHGSNGTSYAAPWSGQDAPYTGNSTIDSVSVHRVGGRDFEETDKKAGRVVRTWRWSFDASGRTGRVTWLEVATRIRAQASVRRVG
ncbi:MAG TPA: hypothetical protein VHZ99_13575 [Steroidobacteraceae bacterium]|jgi:hypothetical protein|nr:hypothetical protein [Steroidobacteraceae bacterium]